jgi:hypothetical protein
MTDARERYAQLNGEIAALDLRIEQLTKLYITPLEERSKPLQSERHALALDIIDFHVGDIVRVREWSGRSRVWRYKLVEVNWEDKDGMPVAGLCCGVPELKRGGWSQNREKRRLLSPLDMVKEPAEAAP